VDNPTMWILSGQAADIIKTFLEKHAELFRKHAAEYDATTFMPDQILNELRGGEKVCQDARPIPTRG